jgi:hypothetical protein
MLLRILLALLKTAVPFSPTPACNLKLKRRSRSTLIDVQRYRDLDALFAAARNDPMFAESSLAAEESGAGGES